MGGVIRRIVASTALVGVLIVGAAGTANAVKFKPHQGHVKFPVSVKF